jgi:tetratricopeptide (TPR) repeat protein
MYFVSEKLYRETAISGALALLLLACSLFFLSCAAAQAPTLQSADDELKRGNYPQAITGFNRLLSTTPNDTKAQAGLLQAYLETGKYKEAEETSRKFLTANAGNAVAHLALGEVYAATGRYAEAISEFDQAGKSTEAARKLRADLRRAEMLKLTGKEEQASAIFETFVEYYQSKDEITAEEYTLVAQALIHLERFQEANNTILDANETDEEYIEAHLVGGDLYTSKYNYGDAAKFFDDALKINPNSARGLLGTAANKKQSGGEAMLAAISKSLEIHPNYVDAFALRAYTELEAEQFDKVETSLNAAFKINPHSLEAHSIRAAMYWIQDRTADFENEVKTTLAINPRYGMLYETLSHFATNHRRYANAEEFSRKAVTLSPRLWQAHLSLGMALIRLGRDVEGREAIEKSFEGDGFNAWAKNSLDLMDVMKEFKTVQRGSFILRGDPKEFDAITPYASELLDESLRTLSAKYKFTPKAPILVEIFSNHDDFAVRALGLPGLGALGVCFGQTVSIDSPSARPAGEFNWGSTLWHEYMHVISLQMTDYRIPRWFSEGLSVYEERKARQGWGDDWNVNHIKAYKDGRWLKIADLDNGFIRPKSPDQVGLSYFQASQVCEFVEVKFGFDAILEMLRRYKEKQKTPEVLLGSLKLSEAEFDKQFFEFITAKTEKYQRTLEKALVPSSAQTPKEAVLAQAAAGSDDFITNLRAGTFAKESGDIEKALTYFKRSIELFPYFVSPGNAYEPLAELYEKSGNKAAAAETLMQLVRIDENNFAAVKKLAQMQLALGKKPEALESLRLGFFITPLESGAHTLAGDLYLDSGNAAKAAFEYQIALSLNPPNIAEAHYNLARAHFAAGKNSDARKSVLRSLEAAPGFDKAQELLLKLSGR